MKVEIVYIDRYIKYLLYLYLLSDTINGILIRINFPISVSLIYKSILVLLFVTRIYVADRTKISIIYFLFLSYMSSILLSFLTNSSQVNVFSDFSLVIKLITIPLSFYYFGILFKENKYYAHEILIKFFLYSLIIIFINLIAGIFGYGFSQYEGNIGSTGFFYAGNEVSGVQVILSLVFLYIIYLKRNIRFYVFLFIIFLFLAIIKSTKTAIISVVIGGFLIPLVSERKYLFRLTKLKIRFIFVSIILFPIVSIFIFKSISQTGLIERLTFFYRKLDFITFILSGRNLHLKSGLDAFNNSYSYLELFLGKTYSGFLSTMDIYYGVPKTIEIDFFDILFSYGIIGVFSIFGFWFYMYYISFKNFKNVKYRFTPLVLLLNFILLLVSFSAGHIIGSGLTAVYIGAFNALSYYKDE